VVKDRPADPDRPGVERTAAGDRRATDAQPRVHRRLGAAVRAGLYRRLAEDDDRAAYWVRHIRIGVLLSEIAAFAALGYLLLTDTPGHTSAPIRLPPFACLKFVSASRILRVRRLPFVLRAFSPGRFLTDVSKAWSEEHKLNSTAALKRSGRPEEIVTAALYLASPRSSFTTGSVVRVDGGIA